MAKYECRNWSRPRTLCSMVPLLLSAILFTATPSIAEEGWDDLFDLTQRTRLTLSLAPDSTPIGPYQNSLADLASRYMSATEFEDLVKRAFQVWLNEINLTIGIVVDEGDPFGTRGLKFDDPRMGDIRIGAIPLPPDTLGLAFDHRSVVSGTWAGTILLNANGGFSGPDHLLAVLIHEAGHVLGLPHNELADSVMNAANTKTTLSGDDVQNIRAIYGSRRLDSNENGGDRNDLMEDATRLKVHGSDQGKIPVLAYGDISDSADEDWFEMDVLSGYRGAITFTVQIGGNSFLNASLTVFDENGQQVAEGISQTRAGGTIRIRVRSHRLGSTAFLRIRGRSDPFQIGSYAIVGRFDANLVKTAREKISFIADFSHAYLDQNDVRDFFRAEDDYFFNIDDHLNDTILTAVELNAAPQQPRQFFTHESIFDLIDEDFFFVDSPASGGAGTMTIIVTSLDLGELIPYVTVWDSSGGQLPTRILANGNGNHVLQVDNVDANKRYYVSVVGGRYSLDDYTTGNYRLDLSFDQPQVHLTKFASGRLNRRNSSSSHSLHIAKSQMFHFALSTSSSINQPATTVWATIYDQTGAIVHQVASRPGELRSNSTLLMTPGSYRIQIEAVAEQNNRRFPGRILFSLEGLPNSKSEGPELIDPTDSPFPPCDDDVTSYCYPDGNKSENPFIWIDGISSNLPGEPYPPPAWENVDRLYWPEIYLA